MMKTVRLIFPFFIFLIALQSCKGPSDTGNKILLRFNPIKGDTYNLTVSMDSKSTVMGMGTDFNLKMDYSVSIMNVSESGSQVNYNYKRVRIDQSSPITGSASYDSEQADSVVGMIPEMMAGLFNGLIGQDITVDYNSRAVVTEFSGMDEIFSKFKESQFGDQSHLARQFEQFSVEFPEDSIGITDSWDFNKEITTGTGLTGMEGTYTVSTISDKEVILNIDGIFHMPSDTSIKKVFNKIDGIVLGSIVIDRKTGFTTGANLDQNINFEVIQMGMVMDVKTNSNIQLILN